MARPIPPAFRPRAFPPLLPMVALLFVLAAGLDVAACAARHPLRVSPVPPDASRSFLAARLASEAGEAERARAEAERALALAPGWVAPARILDDLERNALRGPGALEERLRALEERPGDAGLAYLAGRLEGEAGFRRLQEATLFDRDLAWPHHGVAWNLFRAGDARGAVAPGRRAIERARDPWERMYFSVAAARYLLALERHREATLLLEDCLAREGLAAPDRAEAATWLVVVETDSGDAALRERGIQRALALLEGCDLTEEQCRRTVLAATDGAGPGGPDRSLEVSVALAARPGPGRAALHTELFFRLHADELALAERRRLHDASGLPFAEGSGVRALRMAAGDGAAAVEDWCAALPSFLVDAEGLPREPRLSRLVTAARAPASPAAEIALGEALLDAGWFHEARALARHLAAADPGAALTLEVRAARGRVLLDGLRDLFDHLDFDARLPGLWRPAPGDPTVLERLDRADDSLAAARIDSLDALLLAMQPLFDRYHVGDEAPAADLSLSPRQDHGIAASVVHPGPWFSAADATAGRGEEGERVGGLAAELLALGRFGIFGQALGGGGPDGTVCRVLGIEERHGEHLGGPYGGTVAWVEGTDLPSRPARRGARITGAALHEGYWIDVESVRDDWVHWCALERRAFGADADIDRARALSGRGPEYVPSRIPNAAAGRRSLYAISGLGDLVRLAVLEDRAAVCGERQEWLISFEELIRGIATHEEGHLCDRTRFLPLSHHLFPALGLLLDAGLAPERVAETLEYRAQLVALCATDDPRITLADVLDAAADGTGVTAHAAAYRRLLADMLEVLDGVLDEFPSLDGDHFLAHQLHRLRAEETRDLALRLARRKAMIAD